MSPQVVRSLFQAGHKLPAVSEVFGSDEFLVDKEVVSELLGADIALEGCPLLGHSVCASHGRRKELDRICSAFSALTKSLGPTVAKSGDALLMCTGSQVTLGDHDRQRLFVLLNGVNYNPVFQDFTECMLEGQGHDIHSEELDIPFEVSVKYGTLRLQLPGGEAEALEGFAHLTVDELALRMLDLADAWQISVLSYEPLSPLLMRVTGVDPDAKHINVQDIGQQRLVRGALSAFFADIGSDPLAAGAAMAKAPSTGPSPSQAPPSAPGLPATAAGLAHADDLDMVEPNSEATSVEEEGVDRGIRMFESLFDDDDDVMDAAEQPAAAAAESVTVTTVDLDLLALAEGVLIDPRDTGDLLSAPQEFDDKPDEVLIGPSPGSATTPAASSAAASSSSSSSGAAPTATAAEHLGGILESLVESAGIEGPGAHSSLAAAAEGEAAQQRERPAGAQSVPGAPEGWVMTKKGHVFTAGDRFAGRITGWGSNCSIKCDAHGTTCGKAVIRAKYTNGQLMHWLAAGRQHPAEWNALPSDVSLLVKRHKAEFPAPT